MRIVIDMQSHVPKEEYMRTVDPWEYDETYKKALDGNLGVAVRPCVPDTVSGVQWSLVSHVIYCS